MSNICPNALGQPSVASSLMIYLRSVASAAIPCSATAMRSRCCCDSWRHVISGRWRHSIFPTSRPRICCRSSRTSRPSGATVSQPATYDWRRCMPSSATQRCTTPRSCVRILAVPTRARGVPRSGRIASPRGPGLTTRDGRRDRTLLLTMFNTGARVQEILDLRPCDLQLERPPQVRLPGRGARSVSAPCGRRRCRHWTPCCKNKATSPPPRDACSATVAGNR